MIVSDNGKEYEVVGYGRPGKGVWFINLFGRIEPGYTRCDRDRLILKPIEQEVTLNGIVWSKTGETRVPRAGEWFINEDCRQPTVCVCEDDWQQEYEIITPKAVTDAVS